MNEERNLIYIVAGEYHTLDPDQQRRVDHLITHGDTLHDAIREVTCEDD
jgi:hypothetical protein